MYGWQGINPGLGLPQYPPSLPEAAQVPHAERVRSEIIILAEIYRTLQGGSILNRNPEAVISKPCLTRSLPSTLLTDLPHFCAYVPNPETKPGFNMISRILQKSLLSMYTGRMTRSIARSLFPGVFYIDPVTNGCLSGACLLPIPWTKTNLTRQALSQLKQMVCVLISICGDF